MCVCVCVRVCGCKQDYLKDSMFSLPVLTVPSVSKIRKIQLNSSVSSNDIGSLDLLQVVSHLLIERQRKKKKTKKKKTKLKASGDIEETCEQMTDTNAESVGAAVAIPTESTEKRTEEKEHQVMNDLCFECCGYSNQTIRDGGCQACRGTGVRMKCAYAFNDFTEKCCACNCNCSGGGDGNLPLLFVVVALMLAYLAFFLAFHVILVFTCFMCGKYWGYGPCRECDGSGNEKVASNDGAPGPAPGPASSGKISDLVMSPA